MRKASGDEHVDRAHTCTLADCSSGPVL